MRYFADAVHEATERARETRTRYRVYALRPTRNAPGWGEYRFEISPCPICNARGDILRQLAREIFGTTWYCPRHQKMLDEIHKKYPDMMAPIPIGHPRPAVNFKDIGSFSDAQQA